MVNCSALVPFVNQRLEPRFQHVIRNEPFRHFFGYFLMQPLRQFLKKVRHVRVGLHAEFDNHRIRQFFQVPFDEAIEQGTFADFIRTHDGKTSMRRSPAEIPFQFRQLVAPSEERFARYGAACYENVVLSHNVCDYDEIEPP